MKIRSCTKCKETKSLSDFHTSKKERLGVVAQCKQCVAKKAALRYANNLDEMRTRNRHSYYKNAYGIEPLVYDVLAIQQKGCCAICGTEPPLLRLDHDHSTGKIRQLLCHNCNVGLGHFKDSLKLLQKAKEYLETHGTSEDQ